MEAVDVDFTELAQRTMTAAKAGGITQVTKGIAQMEVDDSEQRTKRALQRGGTDPGHPRPAVAKAKAAIGGSTSDELREAAAVAVPGERSEDEDASLKTILRYVKSMDTRMNKMEQTVDGRLSKLETDVSLIKGIKENVEILESNLDNLSAEMQDVKKELQNAVEQVRAVQTEVNEVKANPTAQTRRDTVWDDQNWPSLGSPGPKGKSKGATQASNSGYKASSGAESSGMAFAGQDQLVIGGFPKGASRALREEAAKLVANKLKNTKKFFEDPVPLYREGRVCTMRKRCDASWSVMSAAIAEYKEAAPAAFTMNGTRYALWLGWQKTPERRKRNAILRRLEARACENGAEEVEIDWWSGSILIKGKRILSAYDDGTRHYVPNPFVEALETERWLEEQDQIFRRQADWGQ